MAINQLKMANYLNNYIFYLELVDMSYRYEKYIEACCNVSIMISCGELHNISGMIFSKILKILNFDLCIQILKCRHMYIRFYFPHLFSVV